MALNAQSRPPDAVVLLLNNCCDGTEVVARAGERRVRFGLQIEHRELPSSYANAGHARRLAMQRGAEIAGQDGVLLTTDADAVVPADWVERNLHALERHADIV